MVGIVIVIFVGIAFVIVFVDPVAVIADVVVFVAAV